MEENKVSNPHFSPAGYSTQVEVDGQSIEIDLAVANRVLSKAYQWMAIGLVLSGLAAYLGFEAGLPFLIASGGKLGFWLLFGVQIGIVFWLGNVLANRNVGLGRVLFLLYSLITGGVLSTILAIYTEESIAQIFFVTAALFGGMSLYGARTTRNIMGWGSWLFAGLIGIILVSVVNIFMESPMISYVISWVTVVLFVALTAYDTQKLMIMSIDAQSENDENAIGLFGALTLYLDFLNLFLALLRLFGNKRN